MKMISYAQNREDVLLARCFPGPVGFYVDLGAGHPIGHSVTKWFYEQGWNGISIEPSPQFFRLIQADRPRDLNLNIAISDTVGEFTFYEIEHLVGCSTLMPEVAAQLRTKGHNVVEYTVPTITLAQLFEDYTQGDRPVEFLKIDVEGHEPAVLSGMDFRRWRPRVLVIEATRPNSPEPSHEEWEHLVLPFEYLFAFFDGLNRYYVRQEDDQLLAHFTKPACPFDDYVLYEQRYWEQQAQLHQARSEDKDRELHAKDVEFANRGREMDDLHALCRQGREEIDSLTRDLGAAREGVLRIHGDLTATQEELLQTQGELAATHEDLHRTQGALASQRKALEGARAILADTRGHLEAVRVASIARGSVRASQN